MGIVWNEELEKSKEINQDTPLKKGDGGGF
jgi:hypothetical protein